MRTITMRLYYAKKIDPVPAQTALMDHVLPALVAQDKYDLTIVPDRRIVAREKATGNEVVFDIEDVFPSA